MDVYHFNIQETAFCGFSLWISAYEKYIFKNLNQFGSSDDISV